MKICVVCDKEFAPQKNSKTCSGKCSTIHTARRQRAYIQAHPEQKRATEERYRNTVHRDGRSDRRLNRAVRLLFALTDL